jgi:hypothetical protein
LSPSHADNGGEHLRCIPHKVQLAAGDIEPIDGRLNDSCSGLSKGNKQFDVKRKSLFAETAPDPFVARAPYQLETAL